MNRRRTRTGRERVRLLILAIGLHSAATAALAATADDLGLRLARAGNNRGAAACESCHGPTGMGEAAAGFPRLAGLGAEYLLRQLDAFAAGTRSNPIMSAMASALTPQERAAAARFYAALPVPRQPRAAVADPAVLVRGQRIAQEGAWAEGVPPCFKCHGANGEGIPPHFPSIVDQPPAYIVAQMAAWQGGTRANDPLGLMKSIASKLDAGQVAAVAAWLATLTPMPPNTPAAIRR